MIDHAVGHSTESLRALVASLSRVDEQVSDADRIDQLAALEAIKAAAAAAQVRVTAGFVTSQEQVAQGWWEHAKTCSDAGDFDGWRHARDHARQASLDEPDPNQNGGPGQNAGSGNGGAGGRSRKRRPAPANGIAAQVALARAESQHRGAQHVTLALTLSRHLPNVMGWLQAGVLSEWRATLIVREAAILTPELQEALDAELAETLGEGIGRLGDRQLTRHVKAIAYRLDPLSVLNRASKAEGDRRVSIRPAPDTMAYLTALLPVAQAVTAYAALTAAADTAKAAGDERGKGQVMADTLVERVTGQATADDLNVEVQVVITDDALFGDDETPGQVPGYGTVPAAWVRNLLTPEDDELPDDLPSDASDDDLADSDQSDEEGAASDTVDPTDDRRDNDLRAGSVDAGDLGGLAGYGDTLTDKDDADADGQTDADPARADTETDSNGDDDTHGHSDADGEDDAAAEPALGQGADPDPPAAPADHAAKPRSNGMTPRPSTAPTKTPAATSTTRRSGKSGAGLREHARVWLRRLYTHPATGQLVAMDSSRRVFDAGLRRYLLSRDVGTCRIPWCDAPIRHLDHIQDHALGGPTTATNGQGLCVRCNHTKQLPGFTATTITPDQPGAPHAVQTTTPTGHTYRSTAPPLIPGHLPRPAPRLLDVAGPDLTTYSPLELYLVDRLTG